jgi:mannan endo-1,4-beta-mannosidase
MKKSKLISLAMSAVLGAAGTTFSYAAPPNAPILSVIGSTPTATRPAYNTGNGFFVLNGGLYDANGVYFRIRGIDRLYDFNTVQPALSNANPAAVRIFVTPSGSLTAAALANLVMTQHVAYKEVPVPTAAYDDGTSTLTSCSTSTSVLSAVVNNWVSQASSWTPLNKYTIINIANEWGPANSTVWRDSYISAVTQMRAAGYLGTLMIDAGHCGQDLPDLVNYSGAVFAADPQKNIIFAFHAYGLTTPNNIVSTVQTLKSLQNTTGAVYAITEFGPGNNVGPSPTLLTPQEIISNCEINGIGWMAWAWDDTSGFQLAVNASTYTAGDSAELTAYGQSVILNSTYGLQYIAVPASIFQ